MAITLNTTKILDLPRWKPVATQISATSSTAGGSAGTALTSDKRTRNYADPHIWATIQDTTRFSQYNVITDGWITKAYSITLGGAVAFMKGVFVPSQGPSGTITSGATTTTFTLSTPLAAAIATNALANRGDRLGYIIRIVDNAAGASGKIEERRIVANTSGTTPTITVSPAFSFTPTNGSRYELLSGALYVLTSGASKAWVRHDIVTNITTTLSTTNLPATVGTTYNDLITLDEQHTPHNRFPGEGFVVGEATYDTAGSFSKFCLQATATAAGTPTGQAVLGDATLLANQFRNFQIRIVEDTTTTPTAVGQRRRITSHTAGVSPVYTLASNWSVTPSSNCKYVIENDNDKIIFFTNATTTYNYNIGANTWDTTTWTARPAAPNTTGTGSTQIFGVTDLTKVGQIHSNRSTTTAGLPIDILDITAATTGAWTSYNLIPNYTTSSLSNSIPGATYDPHGHDGRYLYILGPWSTSSGPLSMFRVDTLNQVLESFTPVPISAGSSGATGADLVETSTLFDGNSKLSFLYVRRPQSGSGEFYNCPIIL